VAPVNGNESRLGQVFLNLIVNAAQAIPEGDATNNEIKIITRMDSPDRVASNFTTPAPVFRPKCCRTFSTLSLPRKQRPSVPGSGWPFANASSLSMVARYR
jgi:hypothetical protein